jgi:hypothetical protein
MGVHRPGGAGAGLWGGGLCGGIGEVISEWEQWAVANETIRKHGDGAADHAASRIRDLESAGDDLGAATWGLILLKIAELQRTERGANDALQ